MISRRLATCMLIAYLSGCVSLSERYPLPLIKPSASYALQPGDVIYVTTWVSTALAGGIGGNYPSLTVEERIALRHVSIDQGVLRPNEAALLGATLTIFQKDRQTDEYKASVRNNEARLWNAFLAGLRIRRNVNGLPELAFLAKAACEDLKDRPDLHLLFTQDGESACLDEMREVRGIHAEPGSLYSITITNGNAVGASYGKKPNPVSARVDLYRAGASMRAAKASEDRWTLSEWEASNICAQKNSAARIVAIRFKNEIFSVRLAESGRYSVVINSETGERSKTEDETRHAFYTLSRSSLGNLFPDDVESIRWAHVVPEKFKSACKAS